MKPNQFYSRLLSQISHKHLLRVFVISMLIAILFFRVIYFIQTEDVGIEHDSGWLLGNAISIVDSGKFASYSNISNDSKSGVAMNIFGMPIVQDREGMTHFSSIISVGPGLIVPQAIMLRVFGYGFWQYRFLPLVVFVIFLTLVFVGANYFGGLSACILLFLLLFRFPELYLNQSFESFGEMLALVYLVVSLIVIYLGRAGNAETIRRQFFIAGILFGLALLTKTVSMLFLPSYIALIIYLQENITKDKILARIVTLIRNGLSFSLATILPIVIFEIYKIYYLRVNFGSLAYVATYLESYIRYKTQAAASIDWRVILSKLELWSIIFGKLNIWIWLLLLTALILVLYKKNKAFKDHLLLSIMFGLIANFSWFILFSATGWTRHIWSSIIITLIIWSSFSANLLNNVFNDRILRVIALAFFGVMMFSLANGKNSDITISKQNHNAIWLKWANGESGYVQGLYSHPIFSQSDQVEIVNYINKLPVSKKIYYFNSFYVAEISALTRKVFYQAQNFVKSKEEEAIFIIGPYQKGSLSRVDRPQYHKFLDFVCKKTLITNDSYELCVVSKKRLKSFNM